MELVWAEVYENERWNPRKNWRPCPVIAKFDPNHWTTKSYQKMPNKLDIRLPSSENENRWVWVDDWKPEQWQYAISFGAAIGKFSFSEKKKKHHCVRRRKWKRPRIRKIDIGTTEVVERVYENQRLFLAKAWKSPYLPGDRRQLPPEPPFQIEVCWKYKEVFTDTQQLNETKTKSLAIWKPVIRHIDHEMLQQKVKEKKKEEEETKQQSAPRLSLSRASLSIHQKMILENEITEDLKMEDQSYILGYLALNHTTNPNDNIPLLLVKSGSDPNALRPPKDLKCVHQEYLRATRGGIKDVDIYRYWIEIVPEDGYVAMGSVVIEKYKNPIDENLLGEHLKAFLCSKSQSELYALDKLRCIHQQYVNQLAHPLVDKLLTAKKFHFSLHRPQPLVVSGIYKLVELPCILRSDEISTTSTGDTFGGNNYEEIKMKKEHFASTINEKVMEQCIKLWIHSIRIVEEDPVIISYATHFNLVWSSRKITTTSNTKAAVWEPVLGPDEFMVGHLAYGDWSHPAMHKDNNKLLIVKKGGSDPDAFKEPLRFECIWSVFPPGDHKWSVSKTIGKGLILSPFKKIAENVNVVEDEVPLSGSFWRAIPPPGYTALGDVALPVDGFVPGMNGSNSLSSKLSSTPIAGDVLQSHAVPKYVCIKDEYLSRFRSLEVDGIPKSPQLVKGGGAPRRASSFMENTVRNQLWTSETSPGSITVHAAIYEQETATRDILSPMFCKRGDQPPSPQELSPSLNIEQIVEAMPYWIVVQSGFLKKKGEGLVAQSHTRFFVLTNEKKLYYYGDLECKGVVDLSKMRQCGSEDANDKKFFIDTKERKWELEVMDEEVTAADWVTKIRQIRNSKAGGADELESPQSDSGMSGSSRSSNELTIGDKESEQQKIVKLLHIQLKKYKQLLQHTKTENETTESVQNAVKWYEDLENTRNIIDILLAKWPRGTVCPPGVVKARADLQTFMDDSAGVIMEDIKAYSNENISDFTVLRLHRACCLMSDLDGGQMMVSKYIEELLLSRAETTFAAGGSYSDLKNIQRRFAEYERQMRDYDKKFRPFIPKWWCLPIQIASRFCGIMGETLDDQLTRFPESHDAISEAKKKCIEFERKLIKDAMKRMAGTEIDVRSWAKWDTGDPMSYIRVNGENEMIPGRGLTVVTVSTKEGGKVKEKTHFDFDEHSAYKSSSKHKVLLQQWIDYLQSIPEEHLIIMAVHDMGGQNKFKKQLGIAIPEVLTKLNVTPQNMADSENGDLFFNKGAFIYIGRKGAKDSYFTILKKQKAEGPLMARQVITPFIPQNRLDKLVDVEAIPFYEGIISQVLERHLDIFVGEEAQKLQSILARIFDEESLDKLEGRKEWLSRFNKMPITKTSTPHFESIGNIERTMKSSIDNCLKISNGKPLLDMLRKHCQLLQEYASMLLRLMNECGGKELLSTLNTADNKSANDDLFAQFVEDEVKVNHSHGDKNVITKTLTGTFNKFKDKDKIVQRIQFFVIYVCMVYNTCSTTRELLHDLIHIGREKLQEKYRNGCMRQFEEVTNLYLSIEEQCLQLIRGAVLNKFESVFQFDKFNDIGEMKQELARLLETYLTNCTKLLSPATLEHFYKIFMAHFADTLLHRILRSNTLSSNNGGQSSVLVDFSPILKTAILKQVPERIVRKMTIYIDRCMRPVEAVIQLAFTNAGGKYTKLEQIKSGKDGKNILSKFFGGGNNRGKKGKNAPDVSEFDVKMQMKTRTQTAIKDTMFAQNAVRFYTDKDISLDILKWVPSYKNLFGEDEDEIMACSPRAIASGNTIKTLADVRQQVSALNLTSGFDDSDSDSDSPLPDLGDSSSATNNNKLATKSDPDYFGTPKITKQKTPTVKSASGFSVKKKKKRPPPTSAAPVIPTKAPPSIPSKPPPKIQSRPSFPHAVSEPVKKPATADKLPDFGLNSMSMVANITIKLNKKWSVVEKLMALRGFDVADQQTIRIMCEDAQKNIDATR